MPSVTVPARLENLQTVKEYLQQAIPEDYARQSDNVLLVAEELLVNVFSYAYPPGTEGEAQVSLEVEKHDDKEKLVFSVRDWGTSFNPFEEVADPDLTMGIEERPIGGLGIFLIRQVSEAQFWEYTDNMNHIRIIFAKDSEKAS